MNKMTNDVHGGEKELELHELLQEQASSLQNGQDFAVVTTVESNGLARTSGKMLVYPNGTISGTVGGGMWEHAAIQDALVCIREKRNDVKTYDFSDVLTNTGIRCQGSLRVFIEYCSSDRTQLVVVGGGHVGHAVMRAAKMVGFAVTLVDTRGEIELGEAIYAADKFVPVNSFGDVANADLPCNPYYVVSTYGHQVDGAALKGVLLRDDAAYIGMLGSTQKVSAIFAQLEKDGISREQLAKVYAPIGLDLGGETPEELAVAIVAEILAVKYGREGKSLSR